MSDVWVASDTSAPGETFDLIRAESIIEFRLADPRTLVATLGDTRTTRTVAYSRKDSLQTLNLGATPAPELPSTFHAQLLAALSGARAQAAEDGVAMVVHARYFEGAWEWRGEESAAFARVIEAEWKAAAVPAGQ